MKAFTVIVNALCDSSGWMRALILQCMWRRELDILRYQTQELSKIIWSQ